MLYEITIDAIETLGKTGKLDTVMLPGFSTLNSTYNQEVEDHTVTNMRY